ncbi:unnamed protein product (macronuclear) [Paramecium tetraurelia]|uniref:LITAF domain-containing protein n=1 Tax=Paramecium tetraurelia TaxID=5888 RepID=A0C4I2_PARTE|nr:uncharacterized protein GSPATT00035179001 [Paramecium tetraurelia]CAK65699.1 unnamed protein product [Paramecium tetraurelia]|eukprot:XP_001433096.1 hypothetical protein (macronuclear) [Paramecium tetraurelia strain d4-2]
MAHQDLYKSQGDEIFQHLERNANLYLQTQNKHIQCQDNLTPQLITPKIPEISSLKEINLVNSLAETGNGQICSVKLICQKCKKQIQTKLRRRVGKGTYTVSCLLLLCSFGILCLACLPCYMDDCKDIIHICPDCHHPNGSTPYQFFE